MLGLDNIPDPILLSTFIVTLAIGKTCCIPKLTIRLLKYFNQPITHTKIIKLHICLWKAIYIPFIFIYGILTLCKESWIWDSSTYGYAYKEYPTKFRIYYLISSAFYTNEFISVFLEPPKKDFWEMTIHHVATLLLLYLSYKHNLIRFGVLILCLHDFADPFLESAKTNVHLGNKKAANILFFTFMTVFIFTRNFVYPIYLVYPTIIHMLGVPLSVWSITIEAMLIILAFLHVIWTGYIIKMAYRLIVYGDPTDTRTK